MNDFAKLWLGQTISQFGSQIGGTAMAFTAILTLNASPAQLGVLGAVQAVPVLLFGLLAGVWIDRARRRDGHLPGSTRYTRPLPPASESAHENSSTLCARCTPAAALFLPTTSVTEAACPVAVFTTRT